MSHRHSGRTVKIAIDEGAADSDEPLNVAAFRLRSLRRQLSDLNACRLPVGHVRSACNARFATDRVVVGRFLPHPLSLCDIGFVAAPATRSAAQRSALTHGP